jgi:4-hydroxy-3-polyprenylbenzoate decarboxylase
MISRGDNNMVLIVGITGATGAIYGIRLLEVLSEIEGVETHVIVSKSGEETIKYETDYEPNGVRALADFAYAIDDIGASLSSGSFKRDGMIIAPCTIKTMSALASSYAENLITRAGDVTLKERKPLVLVVRETPLHLGHLRSMLQLTEMGATIFPPVPSFYNRPSTINEIINSTMGRVLDLFNIKHNLSQRWSGLTNTEG